MFSDLGLRAASAAVMIPAAAFVVWQGGAAFSATVVVLAFILGFEMARLAAVTALVPRLVVGGFAGIPVAVGAIDGEFAAIMGLGAVLIGLVLLRASTVLRAGWVIVPGMLYISISCLCAVWLRSEETGLVALVLLLLIVISTDIGAYLCGRVIGGPKLWPAVSPKKTWAGAIGALVASALAAGILAASMGLGIAGLVLVAIPVSIASQLGDLLESTLKRRADVKDSGVIIPGHGGAFDRLDGFLAASPMLAGILVTTGPEMLAAAAPG